MSAASNRAPLSTCPCCGYPTISNDIYDICPICGWEDDGQDDDEAEIVRGGPNGGLSLTEARQNFVGLGGKYRAADPRYASNVAATSERACLTKAYDALLPDVHPRSFITALPQLTALDDALYAKRFGAHAVAERRAAITNETPEEKRASWESVAFGRQAPFSHGPPSVAARIRQLTLSVVADVTARLELLLDAEAPAVTEDGPGYRCWSAGGRQACVRRILDGSLELRLEPDDGRAGTMFRAADPLAAEKIAQRLATFLRDAPASN